MLTDLVVSFTLDPVFKTLNEAEITNAKEYVKHTVSCGEWGEHTVLIHISYRSTFCNNQGLVTVLALRLHPFTWNTDTIQFSYTHSHHLCATNLNLVNIF